MVLGWFGGDKNLSIEELLERKKYAKAIELIRAEFARGRRDSALRLQMADALTLSGKVGEAVPILIGLADEAARHGLGAKAIAHYKRIEELDPGRADIGPRLAALIQQHPEAAAEAGFAVPAGEPAAPAEPASAPFSFNLDEPEPEPAAAPVEPPADASAEDGLASHDEADLGAVPPLASPLFSDFSIDELLAVMKQLRLLRFEPGDIILAEGEPGHKMFVVTTGSVKAFVHNAKGDYALVRQLGEGDFFGEISLLLEDPRSATVVAASRCELLELDRASLDALAAGHPRVREVVRNFATARAGSAEEMAARRLPSGA